ncbi:ADP-ribosylation factor-like protein 6-interacting protein 4 [Hippoglossus hippoglossus]|uniref:ADP-ribosylation factor-like protein 6-interacting protein 4 n=1 Tax=Hippoglossus hippoglossus TaxID=8267 RepID=UPI00148CD7AD|nr:ADP-ribosylation factor-like protein 6-interacting protein 4 [Hippoglossus hippoglossus]
MVDTVCQGMPGPSAQQTAAEPLPPARALLQEPLQPERPLALSLPEDASGQAVTRRGPLAPPLFNILAASASAAHASAARAVASTSVAHGGASTSAGPTSASTSAAHAVAHGGASTSAAPTSASTSAAHACVASTSAAHAAVASTSAGPAVASTSAAPAAVPRSTAWQRKVREEEQRRAREMGLPTPKTQEYGHSRYRALHFCSRAEGRSVDDWLAEKRAEELAEKERKQAEAAQNPSSQPPPSQRGRRMKKSSSSSSSDSVSASDPSCSSTADRKRKGPTRCTLYRRQKRAEKDQKILSEAGGSEDLETKKARRERRLQR